MKKLLLLMIVLPTVSVMWGGCSTKLVVAKVNPGDGNVKGLRYYLTRPYLKITTIEVKDVYEDGTFSPSYTRIEQETVFLPDITQMYEVNFKPGVLTKNQFVWTYDDKLTSTLKTVTINAESQVPETLKSIAEVPKGVAELVKEIKPFVVAKIEKKKVAESVTLKKVEYVPIKEGTVLER